MSQQVPVILRVLSASLTLASRAGQLIKDVVKSGTSLDIIDKVEADRESEQLIISSLSKHFPHLQIRGEENIQIHTTNNTTFEELVNVNKDVLQTKCPNEFKNLEEKDIVVWVDPLDGTREFTEGRLEGVTVLIGIATQGNPVAGVIHQPYFNSGEGRNVWGMINSGVHGLNKNQQPLLGRIIAGSLSHRSKTVMEAVKICEPTEVIQIGGCGCKVLLVLDGKAHAYIHASKGCSLWDTCAPDAILRAAGGRLTDVFGKDISYDLNDNTSVQTGVLATMNDHDWYTQRIREKLQNQL
ncbi:unnamed protein product [Didymodactylos carnosus]|uniref:3'(2'),5'-bisphosphate nucleotidase 1 n=1 Tax=Didymodactylos carnosus TaxID=1234261 RepID=A0A813SF54_9BILA|nr:unnamed protein product [Didymodactylos carnosus]CAF1319742.1 unnamed protein product [Didymodactylos carnosus]CAF3579797.1 unnamed protein product [Didymodactylos carnosus]CAF4129556.1 unnamed protein product [Didymodactylos carnosus]